MGRGGKSRRERHSSPHSFDRVVRSSETLWANASSSERLTIGAAALAAVAVAGVAVNVLFHISLALAFAIIPLMLAPILLTIMASLTLFAVLTFATAGMGIFLVGSPFLAVSLLAKALFPVLVILGGASILIGRVLGFKKSEDVEEVFEEFDDDEDLERFDRRLRNRQGEKKWDVTRWSLSDVIDELDYMGLGEYRQLFIEERIDGSVLLELNEVDIKNEFGSMMPLGHRMRLARLVNDLRRRSSQVA